MLNCVDKEADFEKDVLTSKTLQLLIGLLDRLHAAKLQPLLLTIEKPQHLNELMGASLTIVKTFLGSVLRK